MKFLEDMLNYRDCYISKNPDNKYYTIVEGYAVTADTLKRLEEKIDEVLDNNSDKEMFRRSEKPARDVYNKTSPEDGPEWVIEYAHELTEDLDDLEGESDTSEVSLYAKDAEQAVKFGEQYARMKARDGDHRWDNAEIITVSQK